MYSLSRCHAKTLPYTPLLLSKAQYFEKIQRNADIKDKVKLDLVIAFIRPLSKLG